MLVLPPGMAFVSVCLLASEPSVKSTLASRLGLSMTKSPQSTKSNRPSLTAHATMVAWQPHRGCDFMLAPVGLGSPKRESRGLEAWIPVNQLSSSYLCTYRTVFRPTAVC